MIRRHKPNIIGEVGAGHSTFFAMEASKKNWKGQMICRDSFLNRWVRAGSIIIKDKVENLGTDIFRMLKENDILFIDSRHTTKEAICHWEKILPILGKGVIIYRYDFTYLYDIYYGDQNVYWEPDVLLEYYRNNEALVEIIGSNSYMRFQSPQLINSLIKWYRWNQGWIPGSLWTRRK